MGGNALEPPKSGRTNRWRREIQTKGSTKGVERWECEGRDNSNPTGCDNGKNGNTQRSCLGPAACIRWAGDAFCIERAAIFYQQAIFLGRRLYILHIHSICSFYFIGYSLAS